MSAEPRYIRANCRFCGYLCGLIARVKKDRVISVEPDPDRFPYDPAIQRGCRRWRTNVEFLDHPKRINYPLKRVGERGSGQWQQVTWDEALDDIAGRLKILKDRFGPETLATSIGGPHATYWPLHRFMNLFGSPNNMGIGQICWNPGVWVNTLTYGWPVENELDPDITACAILWGTNPAESDNSVFWRTIRKFSQADKPLIVIDPRQTRTAALAQIWLPVLPGTDAYLALGLLHVVINEKLYDRQFVENWTVGFDRLQKHVSDYPPERVAQITGVKAELILKAARMYAAKSPASLISGRGIDQIGNSTFPTHRSLAILRAITGNLDIPGASHIGEMPDFIPEVDLELSCELSPEHCSRQLNEGILKLQSYSGYEAVKQFTQKAGRRLPMRYLTSAHPNLVWNAMLNNKPYPVRALIVMGNNPLLTQADSQLIYKALKNLDLLVALEYFKTPTAMLADYILPSAGGLERPLFQTHAGIANIAYGGDQAVTPYYERHPDYDFWRGLGIRLGQADRWPWETFVDSLQATLAPTGVTWEQFCETGLYYRPASYLKHEKVDPNTGAPTGFSTPTGKVELYSQFLADMSSDPLPIPTKTRSIKSNYPLHLITGARRQPFYASSYHQMGALQVSQPEPIAEMSDVTAQEVGLMEGWLITVETQRGQGKFRLKFARMQAGVVSIDYGWWYPDQPACEPSLGGVRFANANELTQASSETSDSLIGTWTYNGIPCRVYLARDEIGAAC